MKKALVFGALGIAGCCLVVSELNASPSQSDPGLAQLISETRVAVESDPTQVNTMLRLAYLLRQNGQGAEAQQIIDRAHAIDPNLEVSNGLAAATSAATSRVNIQDVWVCSLPNISNYGLVGTQRGYAVGTTSANQGDTNLDWNPNAVAHPVICQNLYRYQNGRYEQIGMAWLKHGFCALQQNICGACQSAGGGCPPMLGPGCADPYDSSLNGTQFRLGPHSEVNPVLGTYVLPHATPSGGGNAGRLLVEDADVLANSGQSSPTKYYVEGQYIHPEDAADQRAMNNASYRQVTFNDIKAMSPTSSTVQQTQAIYAWRANDAAVSIQNVDVAEQGLFGRFTVAYRVTDNGDGTWHYEYAIHNMNSDRGARSLSIPLPAGVMVTNQGFHDVPYHSGDGVGGVNYDGTDWAQSTSGGAVSWSTSTFAANANANALRWGTMYNFRFDANTAPTMVNATLGLFKSGPAADPSFAVMGPGAAPCPADLDGDGQVGASDLAILLGSWAGSGAADLDGNGSVGSGDLAILLGSWGACS